MPLTAVFVFIVVCAVVVTGYITRIEDQLVSVCRTTTAGNTSYNKALDALIANSLASQSLTPAQKAQRVQQYGALHLTIAKCPPRVL